MDIMDERIIKFENVVRNQFAAVVWSHKIQEKQADIYAEQYKYYEIARLVASSCSAAGIVCLFYTDALLAKIISVVLSFISIYISAFFKSFNLLTLVDQHKKVANAILELRDKYIKLLLDVNVGLKPYNELECEFENLEERKHILYKEAPTTTDEAVERARKALKVNQDNSFDDKEIDSMLPAQLRKG